MLTLVIALVGNGVRFPRRKFMRRLNLNRGTRRNGIGGSFARRKRNRKNKYGGCARCGRTLAAHNSIAAASANSVRQGCDSVLSFANR